MNLIKKGAIFKSAKRSHTEYVRVIKVDQSHPDWVGVERLNDGTKESVEVSDLRFIVTTKEHLFKLGFIREEIGGTTFYTSGTILISGFYTERLLPNYGKLGIMTGFRLVNNLDPWKDVGKYFSDNDFDKKSFDNDFLELNEINTLYDLLQSKGLELPSLESILEPLY